MDRNLLENNYKKANNQLYFIDRKKSKIKREIYSLYDLYLKIIRSKLENYIGEAVKGLFDESSNGFRVKDQKTLFFIKNDLKNLVNQILPFLTIEQLSIKKEYKIENQVKSNLEFEGNYNLKEVVYKTNNFKINHTNNSTNYCNIYYENIINEDKFINLNLDDFLLKDKSFDYYNNDDGFEFINNTNISNENNQDKLTFNINQDKISNYFIPIELKEIILWIDTLESSLNFYLKDLSVEINNQLIKKNILKSYIKNDLLLYIFKNHFLFSNPSPFVLTFDPSLNQYISPDEIQSDNKFSKINLINIGSAELEFININLSMLRNKILDLKYNIYNLIKKENYWSNKLKINPNIKSAIKNF